MHHHPTIDQLHAEVLDLSLTASATNATIHNLTLICDDLREQLIAAGLSQDHRPRPLLPVQQRLRKITA